MPPQVSFAGGFQLSDSQYRKLSSLVYRLCGIHLGENKRELLRARLAKRMRALNLADVSQYMRHLADDSSGEELTNFLDCITTNKTDFFREPQHFEFLSEHILTKLDSLCGPREPLRLWSAACSSGEEPYTLAMVLLENQAAWKDRGVFLLASDISSQVLGHAQRGVYATGRVAALEPKLLKRYFQKGVNRWQGHVRVRPELRRLVEYSRINLMEPFPFERPFHIIFCRNVMIYFDRATQERLVDKFYNLLCQGGFLFVGHSESLTGIKHRLRFVRPAVYRKE